MEHDPVNSFDNKVALVTGSGRGIGRGIALHLAARGANVVVNFFRNREPAEHTAEEIRRLGRQAFVARANVGDMDQLAALFQSIEAEFGRLDIYIHNAASGFNRPVMEQRPRGWDWTMNINARSLLFGAKYAAGLMEKRGGGYIVALTSLGSVRVMADYVVVGASKAAIESLVRYLGVELAPQDIVVNAVCPGLVETDALKHFSTFDVASQAKIEKAAQDTPAGRLCSPEDLAGLVSFLCSPQAKMICGQTIVMDGGHSLRLT
ncbi:MAG: enoyl-[acyl-carrier-protein] reductase FabL [Chloroflexota bacterium]|nr:MAG: enoyl-[acyl-carrier-protein] reductase FabL [Chloroflexota bacterium]